jgi:hypothetical protein
MREKLVTAIFIIVGLINFLPVVGVLGATRLQELYAIPVTSHDLALLLRHRAVLFGLLGSLLIAAAFRPSLRAPAYIAGFVSMLSFIALAMPLSSAGTAMQKIFWADAVATVLLLIAWCSKKTA